MKRGKAARQDSIIALEGPPDQIGIPKKEPASRRMRETIRPILFSVYQRIRVLS
jgi:hypothetical protein